MQMPSESHRQRGGAVLGFEIIGIVVAVRQYVSADHDAAFDFAAKTFGAGFAVHFFKSPGGRHGVRNVRRRNVKGRRLACGGEDVVGGDGQLGLRQETSTGCALCFQQINGVLQCRLNIGAVAFAEVFLGIPIFTPLSGLSKSRV